MKILKSQLRALIEDVMNEVPYPTREHTAEKAWRDFLKVLRQNKMSFSKGKINDAKSGKLLAAVDKIR